MKKVLIPIILGIVGILIVVYAWAWPKKNTEEEKGVFCTMEAKQCSDGSYVGRVPPSCEFATCPGPQYTPLESPLSKEGWIKATDVNTGATFMYPKELDTTYIRLVDAPRVLNVTKEAFSCLEAGSEIQRAGRTEKRTVNGNSYCVTKISEGAAGSIYVQYAYAFPFNEGTGIFAASVRMVQCGNYDEPKRGECEKEREQFDMDTVMDGVIQSVSL